MASRRVVIPNEFSPEDLRDLPSGGFVRTMTGETMGTTWKSHCVLPHSLPPKDAYESVCGAFELVVRQMSHWDSESALSQFNQVSAGSWCTLPAEMFEVLSLSLEVAAQSQGAYDPTIGKLIDAYGFGPNRPGRFDLSSNRFLALHRPKVWESLQIRSPTSQALQPGGLQLNLSSIAKGFAVDLASEALLKLGVKHFLVEIGGELRGHGCKPTGMPWWVALEQPPGGEALGETIVALCGYSIATSGDTIQIQVGASGERFSHLLDPRDNSPASDELASVSVLHPRCGWADAWATALFVLGSERGRQCAEDLRIAAVFTRRTQEGGYDQFWTSPVESMLGDS